MGSPGQDPKARYDRPIFNAPSGAPTRASGGGGVAKPRRARIGFQGKLLLLFLGVVALAVLGAIRFLVPSETVHRLDHYEVTEVLVRDFRDVVYTSGTVVPDPVISFTASGAAEVAAIHAEPGEDVQAGSLLVELVSESLMADLAEVQHELRQKEVELDLARLQATQSVGTRTGEVAEARAAHAAAVSQLAATERLHALGGAARREVEEAAAEAARLANRLSQAEAALLFAERESELKALQAEQALAAQQQRLNEIEEQLMELQIRATVDGRVLARPIRLGQRVQTGEEILQMADISRQHVSTRVGPEQAASLARGMPAVVRIGDRSVVATVEFIAPQAVDGASGAEVSVRLALAPEDASDFWPYASVTVEIERGVRLGRRALPRGPFFTSGDASFVYVIAEDGSEAVRRTVRYGSVDGTWVEVLDGLEPGERIIHSTYTTYRTRASVELVPEGGRSVHGN